MHKLGYSVFLTLYVLGSQCNVISILECILFQVKITLGRKGDSEKWPYGPTIDKAAAYGAVVEEMGRFFKCFFCVFF